VLCVWAYIAQIRLDELKHHFGEGITLQQHFIPVFGNAHKKIEANWQSKGGYDGFNQHICHVCKDFPHVDLDPEVWKKIQPTSSAQAHLFIKSVQLLESSGLIPNESQNEFFGRTVAEEFIWQLRRTFFVEQKDISNLSELYALAEALNLPTTDIEININNGSAMAALCEDKELCEQFKVEGSPTFILNEGRQKLYGNVGYKMLEANVHEVIHRDYSQASWC
jgi:hypothetical protein